MWGWGQIAAGDRRGWLLPIVQLAGIAALVAVAPAMAPGSGLPVLSLAACLLVAAWGAVAVHAYRAAARRRAFLDLPVADSGAADLLWLAPLAIAASSLLWAIAGQASAPGAVLDAYVRDWRAGDAAGARAWLLVAPDAATLAEAWERQSTALRNELLRLAPQAGDDAEFDPDRPLETVRWVEDDAAAADPGSRTIVLEVARNETTSDLLLGILPVSSQRLVPIARLGTVQLRAVPGPGPWVEWRVARLEVEGIAVGE